MASRFLLLFVYLPLSVLLIPVVFTGCANPTDSPLVALEKSRILIDRNQAAEAIPLISRAIEAMPNDAQARYLRGVAYESLNLPEKALVDYVECLKLNPERTDALNNKAVILARMERFDEAAAEFSLLLQRDPQDALAYRNRGLCRFDQKQFDAALADYDKAIELAPRAPANWFQRGNVFLEQDQFDRAVADYSQAIELDPDFARAWMNRGVARYQNGQKAAAAEDLQIAQSLDDNIILPGLDFFAETASASNQTPEPRDLRVHLWNQLRAEAMTELSGRGFSEIKPIREFPELGCAEFSARYLDSERTVLVTCTGINQAGLLLPAAGRLHSGAETSPAISLLILQKNPETNTVTVRQFEDHWKPEPAVTEPVILRFKLPDE